MKRLLLLFCVIFTVGNMSPAWSTDGKKPRKPHPTVLVKKAKKAVSKIAKAPPAAPTTPSVAALPNAREATAPTKTEVSPPTPWQVITAEQTPVTVVVISPTAPTATPPPTNPYLEQSSYQVRGPIFPALGANPFENLKSAVLLILPDGIGQMHPPLYVKYIEQPKTGYSTDQKPILLFQVSCPTKAIFGFDTPIIAVLQLGVDGIIDMANAADILPVELQKVCN